MAAASNALNQFLSENTQYEIKESIETLFDMDDLLSDDEIWIVQTPKQINLKSIEKNKIKLPGKTSYEHIESIAEEFSQPKEICLGYKKFNDFTIKTIPTNGRVVIRENSNLLIPSDNINTDQHKNISSSGGRIPFPANLLLRHPLHGNNYEDKINISEEIRARLRNCDKPTTKKYKKQHKKRIENEVCNKEEPLQTTKHQSKLTKHKKCNKSIELLNIKKDLDDDVSTDLAWIRNM